MQSTHMLYCSDEKIVCSLDVIKNIVVITCVTLNSFQSRFFRAINFEIKSVDNSEGYDSVPDKRLDYVDQMFFFQLLFRDIIKIHFPNDVKNLIKSRGNGCIFTCFRSYNFNPSTRGVRFQLQVSAVSATSLFI